jgi:hypothetical protein
MTLLPKMDVLTVKRGATRDVRFGPKADIGGATLFDHFVGALLDARGHG